MTENSPIIIGLLIVIGLLLAALPYRRVSRYRLQRFARRHRLVVTVDNGPMLLRYLGTTSAWRWAGLLVAGAVTLFRTWVRSGAIELDYVFVFGGWFVGAVIAEWRVDRMAATGSRRTAALVPRRVSDYVALWMLCLPITTFVLVVVVELLGLLNAPSHRDELATMLVVTALSAAVILAVGRHVLARPQPMTAPDVVAADEVRRAASLRVLAGSSIAIGGYLLVGVAGVQVRPVWLWETWQPMVTSLVALALPFVGATVAILSRPYHAHRLGTAR